MAKIRLAWWLVPVTLLSLAKPAYGADVVVNDVPLPNDAQISAVKDQSAESQGSMLGAWIGAWGGGLHHVLIVEEISSAGEARVIYAIGDNPSANITRRWTRQNANISGDTLTVTGDTFIATYKLFGANSLHAVFRRGQIFNSAHMTRIELADLMRTGANVPWVPTEFLDTALHENGKPIRLEVALFKPDGVGPFRLVVFNHGSTGRGTQPALFGATWSSPALADFFIERGWIVAFPQRRGRGKSDGLYDEGFNEDRTQGYTCDPQRSLPGADRALTDIEAAIEALQQRSDVASGRIIIGGQSRGGVLSVAYAGMHPDQIAAVINFVGGWIGEQCKTASEVNGALFERGSKYSAPTLWLYGRGDAFYSLSHSRANFQRFQAEGGEGTFLDFEVPTGNGHFVIGYPDLWAGPIDNYLRSQTVANGR